MMIDPKRLDEIELAMLPACTLHEGGYEGTSCTCLPAPTMHDMARELVGALREAGEAPYLLAAVVDQAIKSERENGRGWMPEALMRETVMAYLRNQAFGS